MASSLVRSFGSDSKSRQEEEGFGLWREVYRVFDNLARGFGRDGGGRQGPRGFADHVLAPEEPLPTIADHDEPQPPRRAPQVSQMPLPQTHASHPMQAKSEVLSSPAAQPTPIRLGGRAAPAANNGPLSPVADASEDDDCFEVLVELPGVQESDIDIEFAEGAVTISAERRRASDGEDKKHHVRERSFGTFKRRFPLPFQANPDIIEASYKDGVVTVHIPRPPETKPRIKKIGLKPA